ncbi:MULTISPECIES: aldo/keto reductase family oxidoreductase [unclassified Vibrio]|uniref:Aldo/keto reductase family oxidoreductase n=1 Tax=Vibrio sp. HB236076 TaxID=3232307 RepID=A0AB39HD85_9VIBR|nr:aldo/keto reductase family oxidoreductase [Vibrio sp. HB161653]MDP5253769.1 aldo/keto reductase family oxidoreductase [Vibrio sp. HB161653]
MVNQITTSPQGPSLSEFIQGYWRLADWGMTPQQRLGFIKQHLELGITSVDHADIYGDYRCEQLFGEAIKLEPSLRDKMQIITKCDIKLTRPDFPQRKINHYDTSREHIIASVEQSLQRLQVDHLDLLLLHRPDALMDADEVATAFGDLKQQGKVAHFGVSNFTARQCELLQSRLDAPLATNQIEINPLHIDCAYDGTLDYLQQHRIRPMAWSCLAGGEIFSGQAKQHQRVRKVLCELQEELGAESIDQVIYTWVMRLPGKPLPIVGSGKIDRLRSAVKSLELTLTREQWYRVWVASKGHNVP